MAPLAVVDVVARWWARHHTDRILARLHDALRRAGGDPDAFLKEAVRTIVAEISARGATLYLRDSAPGSLEGTRWIGVTTTGEPPPEGLPSEPTTPDGGQAHARPLGDRHLIIHVGEIPDIGSIGVLIVTPSRGAFKRAMAEESLRACGHLLSIGATELWLIRHQRNVAELVARARALPEIVKDLTAALDVLRPLTEAAEVQRLRQPGQVLRYVAAVDRALVAVDRLAAGRGSSQPMGMIDIVALIRERLRLRPSRSTGEPICTVTATGSSEVFGDRAALAELVDRLLDSVAPGASPGNIRVRSDGAGSTLSLVIEFATKPGDGDVSITTDARVLDQVWRARCVQLVATHGGRLEFPVEGRDTIRVTFPVRPTARIVDR